MPALGHASTRPKEPAPRSEPGKRITTKGTNNKESFFPSRHTNPPHHPYPPEPGGCQRYTPTQRKKPTKKPEKKPFQNHPQRLLPKPPLETTPKDRSARKALRTSARATLSLRGWGEYLHADTVGGRIFFGGGGVVFCVVLCFCVWGGVVLVLWLWLLVEL